MQADINARLTTVALEAIKLPEEVHSDIVLPWVSLGLDVSWKSSDASIISHTGVLTRQAADTAVVMKATIGGQSRDFKIKVSAYYIGDNLRYEQEEPLNLTANTAAGFSGNKFGTIPEGLLDGLRSYTILVNVNIKTMTKQPRIYDFGSGSGNSLFLRADALSAGIKLNGGTTTMVNGKTKLTTNTDYKLAVSYDAATHTTRIYVNGVEDASGTQNQNEPYQLYEVAKDTRNYIGRTQWWDGTYASDNQDFCGTISSMRVYDVCFSQREICYMQDIEYKDKELPTALQNGDFEGNYSVMQGSGVNSDRAIYVPEGWTVDYTSRNENDLTALKSGDLYFSDFFASFPASSANSKQTYWIRQNWGTSTITLKQELRLPEGHYTLTADVWKSGLGGNVSVSVTTEGGATISAPSLENKEQWQPVSLQFESDGVASTLILLSAIHTSNGSSKIIGFDNVKLTAQLPNGIRTAGTLQQGSNTLYDLMGRRIDSGSAVKGIFIRNGRKIVK